MTERALSVLTERERQILALSASGHSASAIAIVLNLSERTVVFHSGCAMRKLNAKNKTHAVAIAMARGLISL